MLRATSALVFLALSMPTHEQNTPPSPCPGVFEYQEPGTEQGRWDGVMHLNTDTPLHVIFLNVVLDKKAELLGNWIGEVSTQDNKEYRIETTETAVMPGHPIDVKIYVKYDVLKDVPLVKIIRLNGKEICNADILVPPSDPPVETEAVVAPPSPSTSTNSPPPSQIIPEGSLATNPVKVESIIPNVNDGPVFQRGQSQAIAVKADGESVEIVNNNVPQNSGPTIIRQNQCGDVVTGVTLIVKGTEALEGEWPWQVALYHTEAVDNKYICGGTLVSNLHIITAAHCVTLKNDRRIGNVATYSVFLGKFNLMTSVRGVEFRYLSNIIIHDDYEPYSLRRDIAVLVMQYPVTYSSWIQPACLWPENLIDVQNVIGRTGTVAGWGFDGKRDTSLALRKVGMPVVDQATCVLSFPTFFERFISEYTYCAGFANGSSACNGDSGGGMVFQLGNSWYLRGLVSLAVAKRADLVCDPTHYIIFTDVAKFLPWIKGIISSN